MDENTRAEFMSAFVEATKPFHDALEENKKAIVAHAVEAATHNKRQDQALEQLLGQQKIIKEAQSSYHQDITALALTMQGIDRKLDGQDRKIDQQNLNTGELIGTVKSLANQNKEQFQRISALETNVEVNKQFDGVAHTPQLLAGFLDNKIVQVGIIAIIIIMVYGVFKYIGVDVIGAKDLINPLTKTASPNIL
jgi:hypothetical protein